MKNKTGFLARFALYIILTFAANNSALKAETASMPTWLIDSFANPASLPFSFKYDNRPSAALLKSWQTIQETKKLDDNRIQKIYIYSDPVGAMQVRCECIEYRDFPAAEWVVYFKNTGAKATPILQDVQALDMTTPPQSKNPVLHYARGALCSWDDYQPVRRVLNTNTHMILQPGGGRSSSDFLPFFNLEQTENSGFLIAIGWSGEWQMQFSTDSTRATHLRSGMALTHLKLNPGEEIRSPRIALLFYQSSRVEGQNQLRRFILAHHRPLRNAEPFTMPLFNGSWGGTPASTHLADIKKIIDLDIPVDYYWIDAEWFGIGKWHQTAGDWRVKNDLYPQGFKPISDLLHGANRKFLLWFEPERICEGTPWYTEHKSWLLTVPKTHRFYNWGNSQSEPDWVLWESRRNQICENDRLFNLGNPQARKFLTDYISSRITEFGIDCFRHDANIAPLEFWRAADAPDRQGWTEICWVQGLYQFWDDLLQRHPGLIIDNCASGGRRIDLESLSRSTPFWRTDYPGDPIAKQCHTYGLSSWVPLNATGNIAPGKDTPYVFRSTISSSLVVDLSGINQTGKGDSLAANAKKVLQQYRDIQKYYLGDFYPLTCYSQAADAWMAWQFNRRDLQEGLIQVFRRPENISETGKIRLYGLDAGGTYLVRNQDLPGESELSGRTLMEEGLNITLTERPAAAVLIYKKKS